jgi:tRNA pseudouridine(38-40) synthase
MLSTSRLFLKLVAWKMILETTTCIVKALVSHPSRRGMRFCADTSLRKGRHASVVFRGVPTTGKYHHLATTSHRYCTGGVSSDTQTSALSPISDKDDMTTTERRYHVEENQELKEYLDAKKPFQVANQVVESILSHGHDNDAKDHGDGYPLLHRNGIYIDELTAPTFIENGIENRQRNKELGAAYFAKIFTPLFQKPIDSGTASILHNELIAQRRTSTSDDLTNQKKLKLNFKLTLAYYGPAFCGWQRQKDNPKPSVQQTLWDILSPVFASSANVDGLGKNNSNDSHQHPHASNKTRKKKEPPLPVDICTSGRTDSGVHAISQICRVKTTRSSLFHTGEWRDDFSGAGKSKEEMGKEMCKRIMRAINEQADENIRCLSADHVDSKFHPTWLAKCRGYAYIIDIPSISNSNSKLDNDELVQPRHVALLNAMLQQLEGRQLDFVATSYGPVKTETTDCTLYWAKASLVTFRHTRACDNQPANNNGSSSQGEPPKSAICIELVGNRFLRRMVRILVSTALRATIKADRDFSASKGEALLGSSAGNLNTVPVLDYYDPEYVKERSNDLMNIIQSQSRAMTAPPAPPEGLMFVGAEFEDS